MKLLYVVSSLKKTGLTNIIMNTARNLNKSDLSIHILTIKENEEDSYLHEAESLACKVTSLNSSPRHISRNIKDIKNYCENNKIDIVHAHCFTSIFCCSFLPQSIKKVCTSHSYIPYNYSGEFGKIRGYILSKILISRMLKYNEIISVSNSVSNLYHELLGIQTKVIRNGIDMSAFSLNSEHSTNDKKYDFVFIGSVSYRKQVETLCLAFNSLQNKNNLKLCIVGDGPLLSNLKSKFENSNIQFVGRSNDVSRYLLESRCFVSPSLSEGLPNSVMEAFSLGIPCILSDIPPHLELVNGSEELSGLLCQANKNSIHQALDKFLNTPHENLDLISKYEMKLIKDELNSVKMSDKHFSLYEAVLNG